MIGKMIVEGSSIGRIYKRETIRDMVIEGDGKEGYGARVVGDSATRSKWCRNYLR